MRNGSVINFSKGAFNLWKDFTIAIIMLMVPILLSNFLPIIYYPIISFALAFIIFAYIRADRKSGENSIKCLLATFIIGRTLFFYGLSITIVNIYILGEGDIGDVIATTKGFHAYYFPILLIAPILVITSTYVLRKKCIFCKLCIIRNGFPSERNMFGKLQGQEMSKIIIQLFYIAVSLTIAGWGYFIFLYNSASISKFDILIFSGVPIIVCIIQNIALAIRCITISLYKKAIFNDSVFKQDKSYIRFLVINGDSIYLRQSDNNEWDTPIATYLPFQEKFAAYTIQELLLNEFNISFDELRFTYKNIDIYNHCGTWHFLCFINNANSLDKSGKWISTIELENLYNEHKLSWPLKNEISRIIETITSVKRFNEDGSYKYEIPGYIPNFHIEDIRSIKVSINDPKWPMLSLKSKYGTFSLIRRSWYKFIEGIID